MAEQHLKPRFLTLVISTFFNTPFLLPFKRTRISKNLNKKKIKKRTNIMKEYERKDHKNKAGIF